MSAENIRPDNLLGAMGIDFKFSEEALEMQKLLVEAYKEKGKNFVDEIRKYRENYPEATLEDAIRALYKETEE